MTYRRTHWRTELDPGTPWYIHLDEWLKDLPTPAFLTLVLILPSVILMALAMMLVV